MTEMLKTNVIQEDETIEQITKTLEFLSSTLSKTLGPYGTTTIIQDRTLQHTLTKDGYTVLKNIRMSEDVPRTVLDIVRSISKNLVRTVGDGSTSSIVISYKLFENLKNFLKKHKMPPKVLVDLLNISSDIFAEEIKKLAIPITDDESIKKIASISLNNDIKTGTLIGTIYNKVGRDGFINIENSKTDSEYFEITSGFEIMRPYINYIFANNEDKRTCSFENSLIFMCNGALGQSDLNLLQDLIGKVCLQQKSPLVFICTDYDSYVKTFFHENKLRLKDNLEICAIDIAFSNEQSAQKFNDLALILNAVPYNKMENEKLEEFPFDRLGCCEKTVINDKSGKFINGYGEKLNPEKIKERYESILKEYNELSKIDDYLDRQELLTNLRKRMATLSKSMATIYVGGASEIEKNTRKFLIEDAVYACQSAMKFGYITGGNLVLPRIINKMINRKTKTVTKTALSKYLDPKYAFVWKNKDEIDNIIFNLLDVIINSFLYSFSTVLKNAMTDDEVIDKIISECIGDKNVIYNLKENKYEKDNETSIINSCETDIEIIKASFSIIGLLVTSNQFLSINIKNEI